LRIWKWELDVTDIQYVAISEGAKLLDVQVQKGQCCIWALCDENAPLVPRKIAIYGTGNPIPDDPGNYIATFQLHDGAMVFHAFELTT
jgi:hypothetical protein